MKSNQVKIKCVVCGRLRSVRKSWSKILKTCGDSICKTSLRSDLSRKQLLKYGSPSSRKEVAEKIRQKTLNAYRTGKMEFMKEVWKENSERWQGKKNPRWSGGWYIDKHHYKWIHDDKGRWRKEHRVVVEKIIGRDLKSSETIHHIDENKLNNKPKNLFYFPNDNLHKSFHGKKIRPILKSNLKDNL